MEFIGPIIAVIFIAIVAYLLIKDYNSHAVLLFAGMLMLAVACMIPGHNPFVKSSGFVGFDIVSGIKNSFVKINADVGLMIMAIGGFVAYIDKIGASQSLVYLALKPLSLFRKQPYIAASLVIPVAQILFVCIPSAAGLALLLMATVFPILINLGVSRIAAVAVITAGTAIGIGPASATTVSSASILGVSPVNVFVNYQIWPAIIVNVVMMIAYYVVNTIADKKSGVQREATNPENIKLSAPLYYAVIPLLPLILLIVFSDMFSFFGEKIVIDTTTAMFVSLFFAMVLELIRKRDIRELFKSLTIFWNGMGDIFKSVVTLIIVADIFAQGLIALGFIDGLVQFTTHIGFSGIGIGIVLAIMIYVASMLMGSGNAAFFAFGPLVPKIAAKVASSTPSILMPMQFAASLGRTVSPVSGVLIAAAAVAKVPAMDVVKRNFIPVTLALIIMIIFNYI